MAFRPCYWFRNGTEAVPYRASILIINGAAMDERVVQFRVGVMVLATIIITGILILLFGEFPSLVKGSYTIHVRFPQAPGVAKDTPVRRSGILIGRVTDVKFDENDQVLVTLEIDRDRKIWESDEIRITSSLLGDSQLEVIRRPDPFADVGAQNSQPVEQKTFRPELQADPGNPIEQKTLRPELPDDPDNPRPAPAPAPLPPLKSRASDAVVPPGSTIQGRVAGNPLDSFADLKDDLARTATSLEAAGQEVGRLARNMNNMFDRNSDKIDRIVNQTELALGSFQKAMNNVDDILGDDVVKANLKRSLAELPTLLQNTQGAIVGIERAMRLVDSNLANLEGLTKPLGDRGGAIVGNIDSSVARLNDLLGQVEQFSRSLNSREGSLGQLINNPEVYQQLNEAAQNINDLTRRLRPIIEDARVFSDKIARHPGVIVRDAVKPGSGTKWVTGGRDER